MARAPNDVHYAVRDDLIVRRSLLHEDLIEFCWGEGSERSAFTADAPALADWLLEMPASPWSAVMSGASEALASSCSDVPALVDAFRRFGLLVPVNDRCPDSGQEWLDCNLYDALVFHRATRNSWTGPPGSTIHWEIGRLADAAPSVGNGRVRSPIQLPPASDLLMETEFIRTLHWRRTTRDFRDTTISLQQVSDLLWWGLRPALSASANAETVDTRQSLPLTVYVVFDRENAPPEIDANRATLWYAALQHALVPIHGSDDAGHPAQLVSEQKFADCAPVLMIIAINWLHYMEQGGSSYFYRKAHHDVGAVMQTALVVATALELRTFITAAVDDDRCAAWLDLDQSMTTPAHVVALGHRSWRRVPNADGTAP
jgi:nitroreductase